MRKRIETGKKPRRQCNTCPWRADVDPLNMPDGHGHVVPSKLENATAEGHGSLLGPLTIMTCHETRDEQKLSCVGWIVDQAGNGNNLGLRLRILCGHIDGNVETVGPQRDLRRELIGRHKG